MDAICDDTIYEPGGLLDQIRKMTDEEFDAYIKNLEAEDLSRKRSSHGNQFSPD